MREKPGPDVAVIDFKPPKDAPTIAHILAISSSICINEPPIFGSLAPMTSIISVEGVMG